MELPRQAAFESSRDVLLIVRAQDGRILDLNPAAVAAYGYSRSELLAMTVFDLRAEPPDTVTRQLERAEREGILFETVHRRRDGTLLPVEVSAQGAVVAGTRVVISIIRDVTGRKQAEESLREREWRYRTIFENAGIGIGEADADGRMTMVNERLCEILGRPEGDIIGRIGRDFIHPDDRAAADRLHADMRAGRLDSFETELRYVQPGGRRVWTRVRATCRRHPESGLPQRIAVIEDITARKEAERVLTTARDELEVKVRERTLQLESAVTGLETSRETLRQLSRKTIEALEADRRTVSRELHDSLGASLAALKFMLEEAEEGNRESLRRGIALLLDTIKEVKRISANLRPLTIDDLGLIRTMQGHVQQFQHLFGIRCECRIDLDESDLPELLKIVVYRVLQEALANAGKHSGADRVQVLLQKDGAEAVLTVRDNGSGFDPSNPRTEDPLSGYGLRSMRERVEICSGSFEITSAPGQGTCLRATFPLTPSDSCRI